ncbi:hypothetical protein B9Z19DRAFT_1083392 [Tuber borchii]|uniref:Uncharacterized protein n=1 Tax=Tuber borchii TaxID=42251 RepID=A0A2T6ZT84_TUBBO|nr:hypothetical protein B9Z19DRAFT_1083392 [Tuber borchii]
MRNMNGGGALVGFSLVIILVMAMAVVMAMVVVGWLGGVGVFAEIAGCFRFSCSLLLGCYCVEWSGGHSTWMTWR